MFYITNYLSSSANKLRCVAWGFGAEATRDAITKMLQGWGLSGLK
ncbi:MAG TPA: hypothetical protein VE956_03490 [Nodularia sp. (in: cyanobacteria)]|nr:hypothetical protein [Nodularia sp. (in: cyanobacteria)]